MIRYDVLVYILYTLYKWKKQINHCNHSPGHHRRPRGGHRNSQCETPIVVGTPRTHHLPDYLNKITAVILLLQVHEYFLLQYSCLVLVVFQRILVALIAEHASVHRDCRDLYFIYICIYDYSCRFILSGLLAVGISYGLGESALINKRGNVNYIIQYPDVYSYLLDIWIYIQTEFRSLSSGIGVCPLME